MGYTDLHSGVDCHGHPVGAPALPSTAFVGQVKGAARAVHCKCIGPAEWQRLCRAVQQGLLCTNFVSSIVL